MGVYVISGSPRSGTSLMTSCFVSALGEDRLLGQQFPMALRQEDMLAAADCRSPEEYSGTPQEFWNLRHKYYQDYLNFLNTGKSLKDQSEENKNMNPEGFWEHPQFTVPGIHYQPNLQEDYEKIFSLQPYFLKIVSQGLVQTPPHFVSRVVYMLRHPLSVAKSQKKLKRKELYYEGEPIGLNEGKVYTPESYIKTTIQAALWFHANPVVPLLIVLYEDLLKEPEEELERVQKFIQEGTFYEATGNIRKDLYRSTPENEESQLWSEAIYVYNCFQLREFEKIKEYAQKTTTAYATHQRSWMCTRINAGVSENQCRLCRHNEEFRKTLRDSAEKVGLDWRQQPCAYETTYDMTEPLKTFEESILDNFWEDE